MKYEIYGDVLSITLEPNGDEVYRDDRSAMHPVKKNSIWLIGKLTFSNNEISYIRFFIPFMSELIWADMYAVRQDGLNTINYNKNVLQINNKSITMFNLEAFGGNPMPTGTYTLYFNILVKV